MKYSSLPREQLASWAHFNNVKFLASKIEPSVIGEDGLSKGGGLIADKTLGPNEVVLSVPEDLILTRGRVEQIAKVDRHLREVLDAVGDFALLVHSSSDFAAHHIGVNNTLTDYVKFLPKDIILPTFYTSEERELLVGTSLLEALDQKAQALEKEFEKFKSYTREVSWCVKAWWDNDAEQITLEDWKLADAMYRSRALDLPKGIGHCMVPLVDMANHASDGRYNARFDVGADNDVVLVIKDDQEVMAGHEITINYGSGGACEMIFSYGFLPPTVTTAREMFLELSIPLDDPLRLAKSYVAGEAPGVRVYVDDMGRIEWDSNIVWWACINEEDGLDFQVAQTVSGGKELKAFWRGEAFEPSELRAKLLDDPRSDIFQLRATVMIQEKVEAQGEELSSTKDAFGNSSASAHTPQVRSLVSATIQHLRELELDLLTASYQALDEQKEHLLRSRTVSEYLSDTNASRQTEGNEEEDFS